jgi:glycosyltransferase involved in cell wall biosynthesis
MNVSLAMERCRKALGRPPRVLHIGNIANNAYHNALLLRQVGFDCDVICHDYYHIMGCPEWEDADFRGSIGDPFRPAWHDVDLQGFERPRWFAQGPQALCLDYLIALRGGDQKRAAALWHRLAGENRTRRSWPRLFTDIRGKLWKAARGQKVWNAARESLFWRAIKRLLLGGRQLREVVPRLSAWLTWVRGEIYEPPMASADFAELLERFQKAFSDRPALQSADLDPYVRLLPLWTRLFMHYDIILAYSTDPIRPMLAGVPYFAFEHGTLREIPFQKNATGSLTALAYREAVHSFVTNQDCIAPAAELCQGRFTFIQHPYDENRPLPADSPALREKLQQQLEANFLVFFPTRHDWVAGTGFADKANHHFLRAFARLRQAGHRVGLVCCRWGRNVEQSADLLRQLGVSSHVLWIEPLALQGFLRMVRATDLVADQFHLGAFGGVTFKALAAGAPMCTYLDEALLSAALPVPPPVINCRSEEEIFSRLLPFLEEPQRLREVAEAGRRWIATYHRGQDVARAQARVFLEFLASRQGVLNVRTVG